MKKYLKLFLFIGLTCNLNNKLYCQKKYKSPNKAFQKDYTNKSKIQKEEKMIIMPVKIPIEMNKSDRNKIRNFKKEFFDDVMERHKQIAVKNPCNDPKYVSLQSVSSNEMTKKELVYFLLKEKQCAKKNK
tara:strand:+ start:1683 stop:2072 length:390 start_codon:yes stop_codon:yes gene_type:complete